ncbi:MAG: hypothetical protein WDN04_03130 [Rhodospirillales bacterium]
MQGIRAYPGVADIEGAIDCAIVAVGADLTVPAIEGMCGPRREIRCDLQCRLCGGSRHRGRNGNGASPRFPVPPACA